MATLESKKQNSEPISLFEQVRRLWNINDEIKILRQLIAEIKKFHDKDKVIGNLNPYDLYVNIGDEQVTLILRPGIDLKWSYYCTRNTKDTDIFLLGCVFYFILTRGKHPFGYFWRLQHGDTSHHQLMAKNLFFLEACKNIDARKLIDRMIHFDPHKRPTIEEVCNHPMFREPNQIAPFLGEYAIEDPQLVDEYRPITIHDYFLMASHRFGDLKLERKAEQIQIRPGRYGNDYVNVIIASKSEDEKLIHYWTSLSQISIHSKNVLLPLYIDRDGFFPVEPIEITLRAAISNSRFTDLDSSKSVFQQLVNGLSYLHFKEIIHGTLSPDEVVIDFKSDREIVAKIAKLTPGQDDWGLPTASKQDDVRRLGCILYWLLSRGQSHPFGTSELRLENLQQNKYELKNISAESYHLIWSMIDQKVPCNAVWHHPFFWGGRMITSFLLNAYYFTFTDTYKKETFPIKSVGIPDSDLGRWFQKRGGIPRYSHLALESFASGIKELEKKGEEPSHKIEERWGKSMKDIFPDFPLQLWGAFEKYKVDKEDPLSSYYSCFCDYSVDQVFPREIVRNSL